MNGNHPSYIATEESALLQNLSVTNPETPRRSGSSCIVLSWRYPLMLGVSIALALYVGTKANWFSSRSALFTTPHDAQSDGAAPFPRDFVWGVATSSYQIEGATQLDGRGETIWDAFVRLPGKILDGSTGDVADDHYHLYQQDVALMKSLNVKAYRFSIAWSRILPTGRGPVNEAGLRFYDRLIDELLNQGIEPWITLFHWDLPLALQTDYEGWLDARTADCFVEYARVIFQNFSPKVKRFITLNEPWTYAVNGHGSGIHAPGRTNHPTTEPYLVAHNFLLAHARVAKLYKAEFAGADGRIGISNCGDFRYPKNEHSAPDQEAASRAMLFQWGWFVEPLVFGDYPAVMRERLGERLPHFSTAERKDLIGSADFFGLNYYSSMLASNPDSEANFGGYWADIHVDFADDPRWDKNDMGWNIVPDGLSEMLHWISLRYSNPLVFITENGSAEADTGSLESSLHDVQRRAYLENHVKACAAAINDHGVNLAGYFAWSLSDNFEWQFGFQRRFGICHVDFTTLERTPRSSAILYRSIIRANGRNIGNPGNSIVNDRDAHGDRRLIEATANGKRSSRERPQIPKRVLIGYGSNCDAVRQAVYDGVNVVIWSFLDVVKVAPRTVHMAKAVSSSRSVLANSLESTNFAVATSLNLTAIRSLLDELYLEGYGDVLHFASVGGWNGAHLDTDTSAGEWYDAFKDDVGDIFDGIDWDLEGNDQMDSPYNFFSKNCLDLVGNISRLAKEDSRYVSMAPAQSYLDIDSSAFSRYVNLTDPSRPEPPFSSFSYFGSNVYAYLVQKYGLWIDLISIQFYESYSRATYAIKVGHLNASDYLLQYVEQLVSKNETFLVDFTSDPELGLSAQNVLIPLQKLVLGLGNGWVGRNDKTVYISPDQVNSTWHQLIAKAYRTLPRGFMFWTIDEEGENGIYLAKDLSSILRPPIT